MKLKTFFLFLFCIMFLIGASAQKNNNRFKITGIVLDADKNPVSNAIVIIDNQKTSSKTDANGNFKVKVKSDASRIGILTFNKGYFEEEISGRNRIDIVFSSRPSKDLYAQKTTSAESEINGNNPENLHYGYMELHGKNNPEGEEAVDVGYATLKKKYITTDISFIDGTKKKYATYSSVYDMIREVSGVTIMGKKIIIQGSANMFGSVGALTIVDGVPGSLDGIPPSQVASISVLKGTAAAIYGSMGFGGAVLVRTKSFTDY